MEALLYQFTLLSSQAFQDKNFDPSSTDDDYLESDMESAMDEFRRFEEEMERMARSELESLERAGESARKMGNLLEKGATIASKKYMEAALNSATASMKTAWKGLSSIKVHPS
ncbi:Maternal effect embryo arrest [Salix suchowensis]|nr:Maternal effect embryo arrest [Salix suchowensis]